MRMCNHRRLNCQDASHPVEPELFDSAYPIPRLLPFRPSSFLPSCSCVVCLEVLGSVKHLVVGGYSTVNIHK